MGGVGLLVVAVGIAFTIALGSAIFSVAEWIALLRFSKWAFGIGPRVLRDKTALPPLHKSKDALFDTESGEFKRIAEDTVLFRPRTRGLSVLDAFAVAGTLRWGSEETTVDGRLPLSTILFVGSWLVGWSAVTVVAWVGGGNRLVVLGLASLVPLVVIVAGYVLVPSEVRRAKEVLEELRVRLDSGGSTKGSRGGASG